MRALYLLMSINCYKHLSCCIEEGSSLDLPESIALGCTRMQACAYASKRLGYQRRMTHTQNVFGKVIRTFPAFCPGCRRHSCKRKVLSLCFHYSHPFFPYFSLPYVLFFAVQSHVLFIMCFTLHAQKICRAYSI